MRKKNQPGCRCCSSPCTLTLGPFCDCCGLLSSGTVRIWDGVSFDSNFSISSGSASVTVPNTGTYHIQTIAPYPTRTLPDFTVSSTTSSGVASCSSTFTGAYVPPDRPATVTVTTPSGVAVTLNPCNYGTSTCDSSQYATYMGSTSVTLTHGCWCGTASSITLPVVFQWRYHYSNITCGLDVWVPACQAPTNITGMGVTFSLCGFPVSAPGTCVLPSSVTIPTPPSGDPLHPNTPCAWINLNAFDLSIYSQSTVCNSLYWRSGSIPAGVSYPTCRAQSASSFIWPGGGYITVTT